MKRRDMVNIIYKAAPDRYMTLEEASELLTILVEAGMLPPEGEFTDSSPGFAPWTYTDNKWEPEDIRCSHATAEELEGLPEDES
jgi:hypothetical protein